MGTIGGGEVLVLFLVALIVLGPQKLPEAARQIARVAGELKRISNGFQRELREAISEPVNEIRSPLDQISDEAFAETLKAQNRPAPQAAVPPSQQPAAAQSGTPDSPSAPPQPEPAGDTARPQPDTARPRPDTATPSSDSAWPRDLEDAGEPRT